MKLTHQMDKASTGSAYTEREFYEDLSELMEDFRTIDELMSGLQQAEYVYDNQSALVETLSRYDDVEAVLHLANYDGGVDSVLPSSSSLEDMNNPASYVKEQVETSMEGVASKIWQTIKDLVQWILNMLKKIGKKFMSMFKKQQDDTEQAKKTIKKTEEKKEQKAEEIAEQAAEEEAEEKAENSGESAQEIKEDVKPQKQKEVKVEIEKVIKTTFDKKKVEIANIETGTVDTFQEILSFLSDWTTAFVNGAPECIDLLEKQQELLEQGLKKIREVYEEEGRELEEAEGDREKEKEVFKKMSDKYKKAAEPFHDDVLELTRTFTEKYKAMSEDAGKTGEAEGINPRIKNTVTVRLTELGPDFDSEENAKSYVRKALTSDSGQEGKLQELYSSKLEPFHDAFKDMARETEEKLPTMGPASKFANQTGHACRQVQSLLKDYSDLIRLNTAATSNLKVISKALEDISENAIRVTADEMSKQ